MAEPIPSELYNRIHDVESQQVALEKSSFASLWPDIHAIFAKHNATHQFGIGLLHRHLNLPPEHVLVHETDEYGHDVCRPEIYGGRAVHPASYCLRDGCAMAYEFSSTPTAVPAAAFLHDMATFLQVHHLENLVALSYIYTRDCAWLERMANDHRGMLSTPARMESLFSKHQYIITEWGFTTLEKEPQMVGLKGCAKQDNGGHSRT